jgi:hypothetical protein
MGAGSNGLSYGVTGALWGLGSAEKPLVIPLMVG